MKTFQKIKTVENEEKYEQKLANKYGKDNISTIQKNDRLVVTEKLMAPIHRSETIRVSYMCTVIINN